MSPYLDDFDLLNGHAPDYPFERLNAIAWRARHLLKERTSQRIENAVRVVNALMDEGVSHYLERETEAYIRGIAEHGGWELSYAPEDFIVTPESVRWLLENWSSEADDRPGLPSESDISDSDALSEALEYQALEEFEELPNTTESELYAVLALMKIEAALSNMGWHRDAWKQIRADIEIAGLIGAGNDVVEAMEALCLAERVEAEEKIKAAIAANQPAILEAELKKRISERSKRAAEKAHSIRGGARSFVEQEWKAHQNAYEGNKSAFARDYARIVANKFTNRDGTALMITEKTIREVWLKDTPNAGKRA